MINFLKQWQEKWIPCNKSFYVGGYSLVVSTLDLQSVYSEFNSHQRRCAIETKVLSSHLNAYTFFDAFKKRPGNPRLEFISRHRAIPRRPITI